MLTKKGKRKYMCKRTERERESERERERERQGDSKSDLTCCRITLTIATVVVAVHSARLILNNDWATLMVMLDCTILRFAKAVETALLRRRGEVVCVCGSGRGMDR